jgi:hypothetical protein
MRLRYTRRNAQKWWDGFITGPKGDVGLSVANLQTELSKRNPPVRTRLLCQNEWKWCLVDHIHNFDYVYTTLSRATAFLHLQLLYRAAAGIIV